ncbi:uncharacterized protein MELLADRAFT_102761 [Melampsora larici-populina 98AG31]|uniref:Uncharacterized protein n=1 Tax=Melampsora larici-populina (strain 98AG31 / pathotype 3-4-7) TaxID=747676 RepID=F4R9A5_MELLP|nr:uncharacterized protein MELLADRAFT_102761 [Melampsora larici-populina 98AG31]EGG11189.1 hypothetical protein MELLADRAFT_102761 [Melampsora larici-populina 98AG31]
MSTSKYHTGPSSKRQRQFDLGFAKDSDSESTDFFAPIKLEPPEGMNHAASAKPAAEADEQRNGADPRVGDNEVPPTTGNAAVAIQLPIEGGYVLFGPLRRIMASTTLEDYLCFACLEENEIGLVLPILMDHGVNHFDLFLFVNYVNREQLRKWGISVGTCARIMVHALMFYQFHIHKRERGL